MAQNSRAPRADVINVTFVFGIPKVWTLGACDKTGRATDRAKGAYG